MKFIISTQELNRLIGKIQNIISIKPTIPILSHFLIEAVGEEIILTATDLTVGIRCRTEAKILEEGATTLPAKRLAQLLRELTATHVEVTTNAADITTIVAGSSRFKLHGMSKSEYPLLPNLSQSPAIYLPQTTLKDLLYRTAFAVSKEDNRYVLTGVAMQLTDQTVTFVGTDGKRLARAFTQVDIASTLNQQAIIPLKAVEEILKNLSDEGRVKIALMPDKLAIELDQMHITTKLLSGDYPDVNRVIPERADLSIHLHREELMSLLRQISLFTVNHNQPVRFSLTDGELKLTANARDVGEGHVAMPVNYQGPDFDIAFNPGFFLDILRHCKNETVTLGLTDAYNPGLLTEQEQSTLPSQASPLFVVMPMRLSET